MIYEERDYCEEYYVFRTTDAKSFKLHMNSRDAHLALFDIEQIFRNYLKYNQDLSEKQREIVEEIKEKFCQVLDEYSIELDLLE